MQKRLALATAFAFSIIPFTSFADHLEPDESEIKNGGELVSTNLERYDLFSNNLSDDILIATTVTGYDINPGADLRGADLSNADLKSAFLIAADLRDADLSNADLKDAVLSDADLRGADLSNADLNGATLIRTRLNHADLTGANLGNADMSDADLIAADLSGADLRGADLSGATLNRTRLNHTDLRGAVLTDVSAENLRGCSALLPEGWVCGDNSLIEEVEEVVEEETAEAEDIDFYSITVESLPYSVDCPPKNKDLKIKQNKKEKFVVRFHKGKKFYKGFDFYEAVDVFEKTYEDKCVE